MVAYECISSRLVKITLQWDSKRVTFFTVYAPDSGYDDKYVEAFYESLQDEINKLPRREDIVLLGDFNASVGNDTYRNWPDVVGKYGFGKHNQRGFNLLQFCAINSLVIANTIFNHKESRRYTWMSPDLTSKRQIDFILVSKGLKPTIKNCRSYQSAEVGSDHSLVMANANVRMPKQSKQITKRSPRRYDAEKLQTKETSEKFEEIVGGRFASLLEENDDETEPEKLYNEMKHILHTVAEQEIGYQLHKQVPGLSTEVILMCERRRTAKMTMLSNMNNDECKEIYRKLNKDVKKAVKKQKNDNLQCKIQEMEEDFKKNNSYKLFKMVRQLEGKRFKPVDAIKKPNVVLYTKKQNVLEVWKTHFESHLNKQFPRDENALCEFEETTDTIGEFPPITETEVKNAIKQLKNRKSPGIDGITTEIIKAGGNMMIKALTILFNKIIISEKTPDDWSKMIITPIHKKSDKLKPENYRAIALLSIPGKIFCKIMIHRCSQIFEESINESQFGFRPGRGTTDAIFVARQIIEKAKEHKVPLHFNFIDFKAAFDTIWREALWKIMLQIGIPQKVVTIIKKMYDNTKCAVQIGGQLTDCFQVKVGVRQGCIMSPTLFNVFLDHVMKEVKSLDTHFQLKDDMITDIRYADDTTLVSAVFEKLRRSTAELEKACTKWGLKINPNKCAIMSSETNEEIKIDNELVPKVSEFKFLGSMVPECSSDVKNRISMASRAFGRLRAEIWTSRSVSMKLKIRLYKALILPIAIYGAETWATRKEEIDALMVFEMKCLRAILGVTRSERIRNTHIRKTLGMAETIEDVVSARRLRWFGHVVRSAAHSRINASYKQDFPNRRPVGRPPKRWTDNIREQCGIPLLTAERRAQSKDQWRRDVFRWAARGHQVLR